ncbi:MAG: translation initiation factor IF-2 subunit gamma [Candidatus Lokiarchaeota archaeon]|nr:translation initiation factor IF-2 subunit gamma [Candidatus Lokiarchaeota archaeon]
MKPEPSTKEKPKLKKKEVETEPIAQKKSEEKPTEKSKSKKKKGEKGSSLQAETNVGMVGHVDHGKTTLVDALSGEWTDRYQKEREQGISIKLGYANCVIAYCPSCDKYVTYHLANALKKKKQKRNTCPDCAGELTFCRKISFVDAPGHEILMATMLSGASLMDGACLLISASEKCPQPQTREHLAALDISGIDKIIIVQNKIDMVSRERAIENYKEIKKFIKGTIAENAPIIPISAIYKINIEEVLRKIQEIIPTPDFDENKPPQFHIARSFDVNKPGTAIEELRGGVVGGSISQGVLQIGDKIEIRPGIKRSNKFEPLKTNVTSIYQGDIPLDSAHPGGLIAIGTTLDPSLTKADNLIGNLAGIIDNLPDVQNQCEIEVHLLDKVLGAEEEIEVTPLKIGEPMLLVTGTLLTAGIIQKIGKKNRVAFNLKRPLCAEVGATVAISRPIRKRYRLIGYGILRT